MQYYIPIKVNLFLLIIISFLANPGCIAHVAKSIAEKNTRKILYTFKGPVPSPDGKKFVYADYKARSPYVYVNDEGDIIKKSILARSRTREEWATIPPMEDFNHIETRILHKHGKMAIFLANEDGTQVVKLTDQSADNGCPSWSPDGNRIVFCSTRDGNSEVYIMNSDGSNVRRITNSQDFKYDPVFLPGGKKIMYYARELNSSAPIKIFFINDDGTCPAQFSKAMPMPGLDLLMKLSPNGRKIVFTAPDGKHHDLFTINTDHDTNTVTQLTNQLGQNMGPFWSRDSQKIYFMSDRDRGFRVYVMNADGSNQRLADPNDPEVKNVSNFKFNPLLQE